MKQVTALFFILSFISLISFTSCTNYYPQGVITGKQISSAEKNLCLYKTQSAHRTTGAVYLQLIKYDTYFICSCDIYYVHDTLKYCK